MVLNSVRSGDARLPGIRDIWSAFQELCAGLKATEARSVERRLGQIWGLRILSNLTKVLQREFGQRLGETRLSSLLEALGDTCEQADLGRCAFDFSDAEAGLVHVWQYDCPLATDDTMSRFAASFLEGFYASILPRLAGRPLQVRWLATEPRTRVLRFLAGSPSRMAAWEWSFENRTAFAGGEVI